MATDTAARTIFHRLLPVVLLRRVPFWQRSRPRRIARWLVFLFLLYFGVLVVLLWNEDHFLYPGASVARPWLEPPAWLNVSEIGLDANDGNRINAWFSAPEGWQPRQGAIIHSHGNGSNLSRFGGRAYRWREALGRAILLYDYPGYGKSTGQPSEAGCYAAGEAALQWLCQQKQVPVGEIVVVGESMGGSVAVELATRHAHRLLVLHGAFTSFPDMAQRRVPCYPSRYLVRNRMENEAKIKQVHCPVLITHGTADSVVPFEQGERLFAAAPEPKRFIRMEGHGHGPPNEPGFYEAVREFLAATAE